MFTNEIMMSEIGFKIIERESWGWGQVETERGCRGGGC